MQHNNNEPLGLRCNIVFSELNSLKADIEKAKTALSNQIEAEKTAENIANSNIDAENEKYDNYSSYLKAAWKNVIKDMSDSYTDAEVEKRKQSLSEARQKLQKAESELSSYRSKVSMFHTCISEFNNARKEWADYTMIDPNSTTRVRLNEWAVAARVKIIVSRSNSVIKHGFNHPGIDFVDNDNVTPGLYDIYYKFTHPVKYGSIKERLHSAPEYWNRYVKAVRALEHACASAGINFTTDRSQIDNIESGLENRVQSLKTDIPRLSNAYDRASKYNTIVAKAKTVPNLQDCYKLDDLVKDSDIRSWLKKQLIKTLDNNEAEQLINRSVDPYFYLCLIKDKHNSSTESARVKELRTDLANIENRYNKAQQDCKEIIDTLKARFPLLLALHPDVGIDINPQDIQLPPHYQKSIPCLIGASSENSAEKFVAWQVEKSTDRNAYNYNLHPLDGNYTTTNITATLNNVVSSIICSLNPGNIKITFVDLEMKGLQKQLFSGLINCGLASSIINRQDLEQKVAELQRKRENIYNSMSVSQDIFADYNTGKSQPDYELVILFGPELMYCDDNLRDLIKKGPDYGISVFGLALSKNCDNKVRDAVSDYLTDLYVDTKATTDSAIHSVLQKMCQQVESIYKKDIESGICWDEIDKLISEFKHKLSDNKKVWADTSDGLFVPIGRSVESSDLDYYRFNPEKSQHLSLVIGSTGSGKSVFLHDIITNLMLKYSPHQVHLHLMDFKSSGIELKDYEGAPHVKTLLLDGEDLDMAAAILRNIKNEIGVMSRKLGPHKNIMDYNKNNPTNPLPYNIFIVDECQELFRTSSNTPKAVDEIRDIISYIAKQGRATGFGFVLATQTRIGLQFPRDAESQLNNIFMLKCSIEDAQNLFPNDKINVPKYHVYHKDPQDRATLSKVFINRKTVITNSKETDIPYTRLLRNMGVFNSTSQFCYDSGRVREVSDSIVHNAYQRFDKQSPVLTLGHRLDVEYSDIPVELSYNALNGNLLVSGVNKDRQTDRIIINAMCGLSKYNPSNAKVIVLNGNPLGEYSMHIKSQIEKFKDSNLCDYRFGADIHQNKNLIAEVYNEFVSRKVKGRMGDNDISYQPIVIVTFNNDHLISSLYESDKFTITTGTVKPNTTNRSNMNEADTNLLARIKAQNPDSGTTSPTPVITPSNPFKKFDNISDNTAVTVEEISYGAAFAQMLANGSAYHIHFIVQKNSSGSQFVPDYASRYIKTKADEIFIAKIIVSRNDMSIERTKIMLDTDINHLRVYFQEVGMEPEVMVPYVISHNETAI